MNDPLRVLLVGPMPPPPGGMANQTRQLKSLLGSEGIAVSVVRTNAPYRPTWVASLWGLRAASRLLPYVKQAFEAAGQADVVHVMANSGWAWHLLAAPAIRVARLRGAPVIVNYRGGLAAEFLASRAAAVRRTMSKVDALVVPSRFLQEIFARYGMTARVIPNVVDVQLFHPHQREPVAHIDAPHIVVSRNLERIYGNDTAIRAFVLLRRRCPRARLSIAGSGPDLESLRNLAAELGVAAAVRFTGRLETAEMVSLYQSADIVLNPSRADNTPNSVLEALACGVPVVSTNVGGVPFLVEHGRTAWLVDPDRTDAMADGILRVLEDPELRGSLRSNGLALANRCSWAVVKEQWLQLYRRLAEARDAGSRAVHRVP